MRRVLTMSKVIITMEDSSEGIVSVSVDFGGTGSDNESLAHCLAIDMLEPYELLNEQTETIQ